MSKTEKVKKPRAPRAKKAPPTKEETLKDILDESNELKDIIKDLKDDEMHINNRMVGQLKKVPELIAVTLKHLEEDKKSLDDEYQQLLSDPEVK